MQSHPFRLLLLILLCAAMPIGTALSDPKAEPAKKPGKEAPAKSEKPEKSETPVKETPAKPPKPVEPVKPVKVEKKGDGTTISQVASVVFEEVYPREKGEKELLLVLKKANYSNAALLARTVREKMGAETDAKPMGGMVVRVLVPKKFHAKPVEFAAALQALALVGKKSDLVEVKATQRVLIDLLNKRKDRSVRMNAALALAGAGTARARGVLESYGADRDPWVRRCVGLALARFDASQGEAIKGMQQQTVAQMREALEALKRGKIQNRELAITVRRLREYLIRMARLYPVGDDVLRLRDPSTRRQLRTLLEIIHKIQTYYPDDKKTQTDALLRAAAEGLTQHLDKFSRYLSSQEKRSWDNSLGGRFVGVGIFISHDGEYPTVAEPMYSGPAFKAGLLSHDRIVAVNGKSTKGLSGRELGPLVRGKEGTKVTLSIHRAGWPKPRDFIVFRRAVTVNPIFFEALPGGLGYIRITQFGPGVPEGLDEALKSLEKQKSLKGLILDLRNNPGGTVYHTQHALSRFLKPLTLISTIKGKAGRWARAQQVRTLSKRQVPKSWTNFPMVVLVNGYSASGAELMSGALQDLGRATVVGETTFGKGSGQFTMPLTESRGKNFLHLTVFKYYLPKGRSIHEIGVKPDFVVKARTFDEKASKEMRRLLGTDTLALYVRKWLNRDRARLKKLIETDAHDPARYPEFDVLYKNLDTKLTREQVREVVRQYFRSTFADERRAAYLTDVQEDPQIQRAVLELAKKIGLDTATVPQYKAIGAAPKKKEEPAATAAK